MEETTFGKGLTVIFGPRNSSKTTTLRMIDYCLGESDPAARALGSDIIDAYLGVELSVIVGGTSHRLRRSFHQTFGLLTQVLVDDESVDIREFQSWLMSELGWPMLRIPKGRDPRLATELVPLTFRTLLRHIYRKEGSWLEFASREEEFLRRAVIAFFLGLAESRYSLAEYEAGRLGREVSALEAQLREHDETSLETVSRIGDSIGIENARPESLAEIQSDLSERLNELSLRRREIQVTLESHPEFHIEPGNRYRDINLQIEAFQLQENDLQSVLSAHRSSGQELEAQIEKLERAEISIAALDEVPVTTCPACGQSIQSMEQDSAECYVCGQAVQPDVRRRRIALEEVALKRELTEVREQIDSTVEELRLLRETRERLEAEREDLRVALDQARAELIAPYMTELEALSEETGALSKQIATIRGLQVLRERRDRVDAELRDTRRRLELLEEEAREVHLQRGISAERCEFLANRMNEFLTRLRIEPWQFPPTTLTDEDFTFYVGAKHWETALGAEAKVLLFLAYHHALLRLAVDLGSFVPSSGLAILDNPLQHGIGEAPIGEALDQLAQLAAEQDVQVIATVPQAIPLEAEHLRINFERQYGTEASAR